jgi:hypothetical protein
VFVDRRGWSGRVEVEVRRRRYSRKVDSSGS